MVSARGGRSFGVGVWPRPGGAAPARTSPIVPSREVHPTRPSPIRPPSAPREEHPPREEPVERRKVTAQRRDVAPPGRRIFDGLRRLRCRASPTSAPPTRSRSPPSGSTAPRSRPRTCAPASTAATAAWPPRQGTLCTLARWTRAQAAHQLRPLAGGRRLLPRGAASGSRPKPSGSSPREEGKRFAFPWGSAPASCTLTVTLRATARAASCSPHGPAPVGRTPRARALWGRGHGGQRRGMGRRLVRRPLRGRALAPAPRAAGSSPAGPAFGVAHVLRGGGWMSRPRDTRVTARSWGSPNEAGSERWFPVRQRLVRIRERAGSCRTAGLDGHSQVANGPISGYSARSRRPLEPRHSAASQNAPPPPEAAQPRPARAHLPLAPPGSAGRKRQHGPHADGLFAGHPLHVLQQPLPAEEAEGRWSPS